MRVLGISAEYHDSSAALVQDGQVTAAAAEERFTRLKHDASLPRFAIEFCLDQAGIRAEDLDAVVLYEDPAVKFTRVLASTLAEYPRSVREFAGSMRSWLGSRLWVGNRISSLMRLDPKRIEFVPHHQSHAAQAFLTSGFDEAAILTVDAVGEWTSTAIGRGRRGEGITLIEEIPYPHSIGLVYAAFTAFLGFRPNDAECSTMALAAFGVPRYVDKIRQVLRPQDDGTYEVDLAAFRFLASDDRLFAPRFVELFGPPRDPRRPLPFRARGPKTGAGTNGPSTEDSRYADVAASVQLVLEEILLGLAARARRLTGCPRLCLAGGVAMNAVAIGRLINESSFEEIFIPPDPGDGGAAMGAALSRNGVGQTADAVGVYLGRAYDVQAAVAMLPHLDIARHRHQLAEHCRPYGGLAIRDIGDEGALVGEVADDLAKGRIVGWFRDRFELGPRALGNRSLLVDPGNADAAERLSRAVKGRAAFRPYALTVTDADAARIFGWTTIPAAARRMQMVAPVRPDAAEGLRAALHIDLTTRPQICREADNPTFYRLLKAVGAQRGTAAVLNTSFNDSGSPMVASPLDALLVFLRTDVDTLVLENTLIRKTP